MLLIAARRRRDPTRCFSGFESVEFSWLGGAGLALCGGGGGGERGAISCMDLSEVVARPRIAKEESTGFRCAKHLIHNDAGRRRYVGAAIEEIEE